MSSGGHWCLCCIVNICVRHWGPRICHVTSPVTAFPVPLGAHRHRQLAASGVSANHPSSYGPVSSNGSVGSTVTSYSNLDPDIGYPVCYLFSSWFLAYSSTLKVEAISSPRNIWLSPNYGYYPQWFGVAARPFHRADLRGAHSMALKWVVLITFPCTLSLLAWSTRLISTLKMAPGCMPETLSTLHTFTQCKDPGAESTSTRIIPNVFWRIFEVPPGIYASK